MDELKNRLKEAMSLRNMKPIELVKRTGISKAAISQYMSGYAKPKRDRTVLIAKALNISEAWLLGYDVSMMPVDNIDPFSYDNIYPIENHRIPLIGNIACGEPITANEEWEGSIEAGSNLKADYCLRCKGDSMINARIFDGDIVFIKQQPVVENGEIAAVIIEDEVTLKRVYFYPEENTVMLQPENPRYRPLIYSGSDLERIRILGKAVAFQSYL